MTEIQKKLLSLADPEYQKFHSKLVPNISPGLILGVRTPVLRNYAKELFGTKEAEHFLNSLPHKYYDEYNLHSFLIEKIKNEEELVKRLDGFLPYVDNWGTCDSISPKLFAKNKKLALDYALKMLDRPGTYEKRFGVCILMKHFLDKDFDPRYLSLVASLKGEDYYLKMAVAWYFATALAKQYDQSVSYIENKVLSTWTHNKAITKACESCRVSTEHKNYLKKLRQ